MEADKEEAEERDGKKRERKGEIDHDHGCKQNPHCVSTAPMESPPPPKVSPCSSSDGLTSA